METPIRRIAIQTGGGDAPGLNAVICAVVQAATRQGWECWGIRDGFTGLLEPERCHGEPVVRLTPERVSGIAHLGGTILGTSNHGNPFHYPARDAQGAATECDRTAEVLRQFRERGWDALVAVGGDGTMGIAEGLARAGLRVVGVPKTIDNDLAGTFSTFGFDTAVEFATECIDRLHSTAQSHRRVMVVETMGRYAGWIALHAGLAGGAHAILLPELPFDIEAVAEAIRARETLGHLHSIVVVAEGALPRGGAHSLVEGAGPGHVERLGGIGAQVTQWLEQRTGKECRSLVLGHLLRGGSPSAFDRVCALRFGTAAVRALAAGEQGVMVGLGYPDIVSVPLAEVAGRTRRVPLDSDKLQTARDLGICLG
jgi:6-phosphofructokinase 1